MTESVANGSRNEAHAAAYGSPPYVIGDDDAGLLIASLTAWRDDLEIGGREHSRAELLIRDIAECGVLILPRS